ncbi:alpha/beta fold hydrolase [Nocardia thailandica]|uniref:Alpha/beta fold hydrolase n=1 Tax=Nocardia thailandica TaxID=257275 RepID=A0ABW6PRW8_9NOCA
MSEDTIDLGEVVLRATITGTGPTVLLLHAGGENRSVWAPVAAALTGSGLRTVAVDLRGHGESTGRATTLRPVAADVRALVRREHGPIVVVGASLGGLAALAALTDADVARRVAGLVLVDVVPDPDPARVRAWLAGQGLTHRHADLVDDILAAGADLSAPLPADLPVVLVRAGRSPLGDPEVRRFRDANPRVTVTAVPGAGHLVARDAPAELARIIADHATVRLAAAPAVRAATALQRSLGADRIDHPGGTLAAHLHRVHALTVEWDAAPRTRLAALCHATYGTDGFAHPLLPLTQRPRLRAVIGEDAEELVYRYGACDRDRTYPGLGAPEPLLTDRFTGATTALRGPDPHDFAVLTIANELDVLRHASLPDPTRAGIARLFAALAPYAPDEAAAALAAT